MESEEKSAFLSLLKKFYQEDVRKICSEEAVSEIGALLTEIFPDALNSRNIMFCCSNKLIFSNKK